MRTLATLQLAYPPTLSTTLPLPPASSFYAPHCKDDASSSSDGSDGSSKLIGLISTFTLHNNDADVGVVVSATPISSAGACQALAVLPAGFARFNATFLLTNFAFLACLPACLLCLLRLCSSLLLHTFVRLLKFRCQLLLLLLMLLLLMLLLLLLLLLWLLLL